MSLQEELYSVWGTPEADLLAVDGEARFTSLSFENALLHCNQSAELNKIEKVNTMIFHELHVIVMLLFILWLQKVMKVDAIIHVGAHGTLEWLPGKAVALSDNCWPEVLAGNMPIIYPFIINDPGEACRQREGLAQLL